MGNVSNTEDVMDSRDVVERIEELEAERQALQDVLTEDDEQESQLDMMNGNERAHAELALREWDASDDADELKALLAFREELEGYCGDKWDDGVQLIRDSYFETAMDELLEDIGDLPKNLPSYLTITIDYDALKQDYTSGEFDGVTYWAR